jgi:hypothetical protein
MIETNIHRVENISIMHRQYGGPTGNSLWVTTITTTDDEGNEYIHNMFSKEDTRIRLTEEDA